MAVDLRMEFEAERLKLDKFRGIDAIMGEWKVGMVFQRSYNFFPIVSRDATSTSTSTFPSHLQVQILKSSHSQSNHAIGRFKYSASIDLSRRLR